MHRPQPAHPASATLRRLRPTTEEDRPRHVDTRNAVHAPRRSPVHGLLSRTRAVRRCGVGTLHRDAPLRRPGGPAGHQRLLGTRRLPVAAGPASRRARHRGRGHPRLRLRGDDAAGVWPDPHGTAPRGRQPRHVPRSPGRAGDEIDRHARHRRPEAALAAANGAAREDRCIRPHRACSRLGFGRPRDHRPPRRERLDHRRRQALDRQRHHRRCGRGLGSLRGGRASSRDSLWKRTPLATRHR